MNERPSYVSQWESGWLQVKVPLPFSLKWVNAYLLPEGSEKKSWTLIDPGLRTEDTEVFWTEVLSELSIDWLDIHSIVITHHHPDHYGMAGWFQEKTGATVWMSQAALDCARRLWGEDETFSEELTEAFLQHGMAEELREEMLAHMRGFRYKVSPQPVNPSILHPGERYRMGDTNWKIFGGEGHAPGHLIFLDKASGKLICGDQVLPDISPNIGWMPGGDPDPLGSFLASLREMRLLEVTMVFPGHREPFLRYRHRIEELLDHHERRLDKMTELIGKDERTAFELCELLFGAHLRRNIHNMRFALAETIAHVIQLEKRGIVVRLETGHAEDGNARICYRSASTS